MENSKLKMHKYILGWAVIFAAFVVSFPMAMMRVSNTDKFAGQPFKSKTCEGEIPTQPTVTQFATCAQLQATSK